MAAKRSDNHVLIFLKRYPKSSSVLIILSLYQLIMILFDPFKFRLVGLGIYLVVAYLIIIGSAKPALEYHFSKFEKSKKDQIALLSFFVLYIINLFVDQPYSFIIFIVMAVIFFRYLFKYLFILIDIFAAGSSKERLK